MEGGIKSEINVKGKKEALRKEQWIWRRNHVFLRKNTFLSNKYTKIAF